MPKYVPTPIYFNCLHIKKCGNKSIFLSGSLCACLSCLLESASERDYAHIPYLEKQSTRRNLSPEHSIQFPPNRRLEDWKFQSSSTSHRISAIISCIQTRFLRVLERFVSARWISCVRRWWCCRCCSDERLWEQFCSLWLFWSPTYFVMVVSIYICCASSGYWYEN